jgi:hypothetical protein
MRYILPALAVILAVFAEGHKGIRFWNLTASTIVSFQLSPAGQKSWGKNQCENDRDGSVDHDERLKISDVEPGHYDVKLKDKDGRACVIKNIEIKAGGVFSIEEKELTDCTK